MPSQCILDDSSTVFHRSDDPIARERRTDGLTARGKKRKRAREGKRERERERGRQRAKRERVGAPVIDWHKSRPEGETSPRRCHAARRAAPLTSCRRDTLPFTLSSTTATQVNPRRSLLMIEIPGTFTWCRSLSLRSNDAGWLNKRYYPSPRGACCYDTRFRVTPGKQPRHATILSEDAKLFASGECRGVGQGWLSRNHCLFEDSFLRILKSLNTL